MSKKTKRVVVTGLGICAPNGIGIPEFWKNTKLGVSGIRFIPQLRELNFTCQIAAQPQVTQEHINTRFTKLEQRGLNSTGIVYGVLAGLEAWEDADLLYNDTPDYDTGIIFGTGILGVDKFREAIHKIDAGNTRRLGSTSVLQTMASGISTYLNSKLGCGNQVTTNSSACSTGTEAVLMAYDRIKSGQAKRILVGSCSDSGPYVWGGFDAMRILPHDYNDKPTEASRPMSATASGFVPGSGAGALVIESLESAEKRGAKIYAEISGGHLNSGGQLAGGSMTAPNGQAVRRCISKALKESRVQHDALSAINGHLTATKKDSEELYNWKRTLKIEAAKFPPINSLKGLIGHGLASSGSMECVATVLQIKHQTLFGNVNASDVHPDIQKLIPKEAILQTTKKTPLQHIAKASFGFGDVNAVVIFSKFEP
ncbi:beta-ketoacyl-[acyl-carrier-protein] synthase family protein [Croceibacter atlanticus]|uniref:beta-ketoacyl-[acyl-carrier-protein] synthase family protein n=1 Tax=Croceibacter atlanticus TaxID=313588 RepID=UPI0032B29814